MTADEVPHLQVIDRLWTLPVVEQAYTKSAGVYNRVKGCNSLVNWALQSAEGIVGTAVGTVTPIASKFKQPITDVDAKLCKGLDALQEKVPIVKEQPGEIYDKAKTFVTSNIPSVNGISNASIKLRDRGWNKANEILSTPYGHFAMNSFDATSFMADKYIDYYLPPTEGEEELHPHSNAECEDKVMHTIHTVGTISNKMGHRVYRALSQRVADSHQLQMEPVIKKE